MQNPLRLRPTMTASEQVVRKIGAFVLFAVCATLPFNGIIALKRFLLLLLVGVAAFLLSRGRGRGRWPHVPPSVWIWFALAPLSVIWSVDSRFSASELLPDALYPLLGMLAAVIVGEGWQNAKASLAGLFSGAVVVIAVGLWQASHYAYYDWYELAHGFGQFSTYLIVLLPFVLLGILEARKQRRAIATGLLQLLLCSILIAGYSTVNRMYWLSFLTVLGVIFAGALLRQEFENLRREVLIAATGIGLGVVGCFIYAVNHRTANAIGLPAEMSLVSTFDNSERYEMWRFWIERIPEHPWLGIGFGYDLPMLTFRSIKPAHWFGLMFAHAHNLFIDIAVRQGLLGLAVFVAAIASLCRIFWRALRGAEHRLALVGIAGLSLIAGVLSKNLTDDFFTRGPLFNFWLLIGLLLGVLRTADRE